MSPLKDWRYEELREKLVAELPPRKRDEDPRLARLRVALRRGAGLDADYWELEALALLDAEDLT